MASIKKSFLNTNSNSNSNPGQLQILVFFIYRTGSSFIMQALNSCLGAKIFGDYGEILTPSEIRQTGFANTIDIDDSGLANYAVNNIEGYLRYLSSISDPNAIICSKISLFQLEHHIKNKTIQFRNIISKPNTKIIILKRNLLDVYVSLKKANETKKWGWVDTTNIKININPEEYMKWYSETNELYDNLITNLISLNKSFITVNYEELNMINTDLNKVKLILSKLYANEINLRLSYSKFQSTNFLIKQDRNLKHKDKIENYNEIRDLMIGNGLGYLLRV